MPLLLRVGSITLSPKRIVTIVVVAVGVVVVVEAPTVRAGDVEVAPRVHGNISPHG